MDSGKVSMFARETNYYKSICIRPFEKVHPTQSTHSVRDKYRCFKVTGSFCQLR